jgi:hypothetical protein
MKKIDEILNIQKAILINEQLRKELKENEEPNIVGQEGISKRIAELTQQRDILQAEVRQKNAKIKKLNAEIKRWENEISPNQINMFDMDSF